MDIKNGDTIYEILRDIKYEIKSDIKDLHEDVTDLKVNQAESKAQHTEISTKLEHLSSDIESVKYENIIQTKDVAENKESLIEHMSNNRKLSKLIELQEKRFDHEVNNLKKPAIARAYFLKVAAAIATLSGAAYGIYRVIGMFSS